MMNKLKRFLFDALPALAIILSVAITVLSILALYKIENERKDYAAQCNINGGVAIFSEGTQQCISAQYYKGQ